jgi:hypothetical protein
MCVIDPFRKVETMDSQQVCEPCREFVIDLLEKRIRKILEVGREEDPEADANGDDIGQSHCFHLMEIQRILRGQHTCGVFDDYGQAPSSEGRDPVETGPEQQKHS